MTANHAHTPTATQIREDYAHLRYHFADGWSVGEERVQFDNWLTAEIVAAEQRGAERALRELAKDAALVPAAPDKAAKFYRDRADRIADRLEGDDD